MTTFRSPRINQGQIIEVSYAPGEVPGGDVLVERTTDHSTGEVAYRMVDAAAIDWSGHTWDDVPVVIGGAEWRPITAARAAQVLGRRRNGTH